MRDDLFACGSVETAKVVVGAGLASIIFLVMDSVLLTPRGGCV